MLQPQTERERGEEAVEEDVARRYTAGAVPDEAEILRDVGG
jgi:hypothetical protein